MGQGFLEAPAETWFSQAKLLLEFIAVLWAIAIVDIGLLGHALLNFVIQKPRTLGGLFYYPFISGLFHVDWEHLIGNSLYCLIFGGLIVLIDPTQLWMVTIVTAVLSGLGEWVIGRGPSCGASGIIFGYLGFIITNAALARDLPSAAILAWLIFTFLFGTKMFYRGGDWEQNTNSAAVKRAVWDAGKRLWGVFPGDNKRAGWEAHLLGLLSGAFAAQYKTALTPWINQFIRWVQGF
jgi:membrane associated rhomboid family serine protease